MQKEEKVVDVVGGDGYSGGWDSLNATALILHAPVLDDDPESVVGNEVEIGEEVVGEGACETTLVKPRFYGLSIVGNAGAERDGVFHQLERNWALEVVGSHHHLLLHLLFLLLLLLVPSSQSSPTHNHFALQSGELKLGL